MTELLPASSPHRHAGASVRAIMLKVVAALAPGLVVYAVLFGPAILIQCLLAAACALALEALALTLRRRPLDPYLLDGSVVVTALLFALAVPPLLPWWITAAGILFAVAVAKHAFGGLGYNLFNPAMAGYVFVLLCFPVQMNHWPDAAAGAPAFGDALAAIFNPDSVRVDALSGPTALNRMQSQLASMHMVTEIRTEPLFGTLAGQGWEWVAAAWLAGGAALMFLRIIAWQIPAAMLAAMAIAAGAFNFYNPDLYPGPLFHLFAGGTLLGAFFIATDPVTASTTPRGRLIYGALVGLLAFAIRTFGAFPDGIAFAVLLGNAAAPVIDRFTRPRVLGEQVHGP